MLGHKFRKVFSNFNPKKKEPNPKHRLNLLLALKNAPVLKFDNRNQFTSTVKSLINLFKCLDLFDNLAFGESYEYLPTSENVFLVSLFSALAKGELGLPTRYTLAGKLVYNQS
ncbi:hypothetical protein JCM10212_000898 [Sporobolomyces blumeae]